MAFTTVGEDLCGERVRIRARPSDGGKIDGPD
jgi:hypothetical protein